MLPTVKVYWSGFPAMTGFGEPVFVIVRFACAVTTVFAVNELLSPVGILDGRRGVRNRAAGGGVDRDDYGRRHRGAAAGQIAQRRR